MRILCISYCHVVTFHILTYQATKWTCLFYSHKMYRSLYRPKWQFPFPPILVKSQQFHIHQAVKRVTLFWAEPPVWDIIGSTPPSQHTPPPYFQMPLPVLFTVIRLQRKLSQISPPQHAASEILTQNWPSLSREEGEGGREESHIKVTGIFTVSLGGLNCRFLSHSRFLAMESLFAHSGITYRACKKKVTKKCRDLLVWSPFEPHPHWSPLGV